MRRGVPPLKSGRITQLQFLNTSYKKPIKSTVKYIIVTTTTIVFHAYCGSRQQTKCNNNIYIFITEKRAPTCVTHTPAVYFLLLSCRLLAVATGLEDDSPVFGVPAEKRGPLAGVGVPNTPAGLPKAPVDPAAKLNALLDG